MENMCGAESEQPASPATGRNAAEAPHRNPAFLPYPPEPSETLPPQDRARARRNLPALSQTSSSPSTSRYTADPTRVSSQSKPQYWGVKAGHCPGIYYDEAEAAKQIEGFSKPVLRLCKSFRQVEDFMNHAPEACHFTHCHEYCKKALLHKHHRDHRNTPVLAPCVCCGQNQSPAEVICDDCFENVDRWTDRIIEGFGLDHEQEKVFRLAASGGNLFVTGAAGTGKSRLAEALVKYLRGLGLVVAAMAPEGIPSASIGGVALKSVVHSLVGYTKKHQELSLEEACDRARSRAGPTFPVPDAIVCDEISMFDSNTLDRLGMMFSASVELTNAGQAALPFAGAQVIFFGDFSQVRPLSPLANCLWCGCRTQLNEDAGLRNCALHGDYYLTNGHAFCSVMWTACRLFHRRLTRTHRHDDEELIECLRKLSVWSGQSAAAGAMEHLQLDQTVEEALRNLRLDASGEQGAMRRTTLLHPKAPAVDAENKRNFELLKTPAMRFHAIDNFLWHSEQHPGLAEYEGPKDDFLKGHELPSRVDLKEGMKVLLVTKFDEDQRLVSGSLGEIIGWEAIKPDDPPATQTPQSQDCYWNAEQRKQFQQSHQGKRWPVVKFESGVTRTIQAIVVTQRLGNSKPHSLLSRTQIPLIPGYAVQIHRAQGMTLSKVDLDLAECKHIGQVYTALSRTRSRDDISITSYPDPSILHVAEEMRRFGAADPAAEWAAASCFDEIAVDADGDVEMG